MLLRFCIYLTLRCSDLAWHLQQFMWPFALLALACVPMMGFATSLEMKNFLGEDVGDDNANDETSSPGGIIMETLLNMTTVSALNMEETRYEDFQHALDSAEEHPVRDGALQGK